MSNWSQVNYIKNLAITIDGGQNSSSIYGNGRNCAAVTVSFNGTKDRYADQCIDLSKENVGPYTDLVDFVTGRELPWDKIAEIDNGLSFSYSKGKFCNSSTESVSPYSGLDGDKRASVTYYVFGKCKIDIKRMIAFRIKLPDRVQLSTKDGDEPHKVDLLIKSPIRYGASDLSPLKWQTITDHSNVLQWVAFVKLREEFGTKWYDCTFERFQSYEGDFAYANRSTPFQSDKDNPTYQYFLCPLGKQSSRKLKSFEILSRYFTKEGTGEIDVHYNQEPDSLCIVWLKVWPTTYGSVRVNDDEGFFNLYDVYGNLGQFKLNCYDPLEPNVISQNFE